MISMSMNSIRAVGMDGGEVGTDFNAQGTSISRRRAAEDYVELLISRGYRLIDRTGKTIPDSRTDIWFFQCDERGLDTMDKSNIHAHVRGKRNTYYEWGACNVEVRFVEGISMAGHKKGRLTGHDDDDDICANDCSWCHGDGECDDCGGDGNAPG